MQVLVIAPMPTHPATQGSRQRAYDIARAFQRKGDQVTFLYWNAEGLQGDALRDMATAWDDVHIVSPHGFRERRSHKDHYGIDDWYHDAIGKKVRELDALHHYDVCVLNYVWLSRALVSLSERCVKVIDTHDLFGDRAEKFHAIGREPEWYYTSVEEERRGLDRGDLIVAIQHEEADELITRTSREVFEVGFLSHPFPSQRRQRAGESSVRVGYIGSGNPFNASSVLALCDLMAQRSWPADVEFVVAGSICDVLRTIPGQPFKLLGRVDDLDDFYAELDLAINPMMGGTGLKIKTIEALAHGGGMIGTRSAFAGIPTDLPEQSSETLEEFVDHLAKAVVSRDRLNAIRTHSIETFARYIQHQSANFDALYGRIRELRGRRKP